MTGHLKALIWVVFSLGLLLNLICAEGTEAEMGSMDYPKRAYHFFRLRKRDNCVSLSPRTLEALRDPTVLCPEDRNLLFGRGKPEAFF
ncbi:unnamed protein product [Calicophoron daubneyi]|uniref:Uncharacterized protein n=1 Tax=Calicophoron daubneyi TaxID=300641 RepID=A0AAV2TUX6_CALDB